MAWWDELSAGWWPRDTLRPEERGLRGWIETKHDVASHVRPSSIAEIGVRAGYSAFAMLSASPEATYLGIDVGWPNWYLAEMGALGREEGALSHARLLLSRFKWISIVEVDSHSIWRLPPVDLLHIDGDHSFGGLAADLELAWRSGVRWVLVDDYRTGHVVPAVTDAWAARKEIEVEAIDDGFRGSALLDLDAAEAATAYEDGLRPRGR